MLRKATSSVTVALGRTSLISKISKSNFVKNFVIKLTALRRV
jgi:hypothetical protein